MNTFAGVLFVLVLVSFAAVCNADRTAPVVTFDLSLPPKERWDGAIRAIIDWNAPFGAEAVVNAITAVRSTYEEVGCTEECRAKVAAVFASRHPESFEEICGVTENFRSRGIRVTAEDLASFEYLYEFSHVSGHKTGVFEPMGCTSVVACGKDGSAVVHGRNLDWSPPKIYRNITIDATWQYGSGDAKQSVVYSSQQLLLSFGAQSGAKGGAFAISLNFKYGHLTLDQLLGCISDPQAISPVQDVFRSALEGAKSFREVVSTIENGRACAPFYATISGPEPGDGVVITKDTGTTGSVKPNWIDCSASAPSENGGWFVAQTNYDWTEPQPPRDDRLGIAVAALRELGREKAATVGGMLDVLSRRGTDNCRGVLNAGTIFSSVMLPATGNITMVIRDT